MSLLRKATATEQEAIDLANSILEPLGLEIPVLAHSGGGAVIPSKGF